MDGITHTFLKVTDEVIAVKTYEINIVINLFAFPYRCVFVYTLFVKVIIYAFLCED